MIVDDASFKEESVLFNVGQTSLDGISPAKVKLALGPFQRSSLPRDEFSEDVSRERRSPENFYPSPRQVEPP